MSILSREPVAVLQSWLAGTEHLETRLSALRVPGPCAIGDSALDSVAYLDLGVYSVIRHCCNSWMIRAPLMDES